MSSQPLVASCGIDVTTLKSSLAATEEAIEVYRKLAAASPDAFLPELAGSLNNLGNRLSELGRREEGRAAMAEAVDIRRKLAAATPNRVLRDLATSLNNLGHMLVELERPEEALAATSEASGIAKRLGLDSRGTDVGRT